MTLIKSISGIRGTIGGKAGDALTPFDIIKYTVAFGLWAKKRFDNNTVVIGRDGRVSGEMVRNLVAGALQSIGVNVIDLGLSTTPTVEIAVPLENAAGGIIITASHNPKQWNALKLLNNKGEFVSEESGREILRIADKDDFKFADVKALGAYRMDDSYLDKHIGMILSLPLVDKNLIEKKDFKVVIDCINSTGGIAVPKLLNALGIMNVVQMNCVPDGHFAHNPEPLPEHLSSIANEVKNTGAHLGIVVDPDVDRLAFISSDGAFFGEEYTLVAIADYILQNKKGNSVSNLSSTRALKEITEKRGGEYHASAVGEVHVVNKMKAVDAVIGGEGNGGIIYPELHYGRDALVGIALFLTHLAKSGKSSAVLRSSYPNYCIAKNKIELTPGIDIDKVFQKIKNKYKKQPINMIDGIRIDFDGDWVHLRKSNTEPIIRIYAESSSETTANSMAGRIMSDIKDFTGEP